MHSSVWQVSSAECLTFCLFPFVSTPKQLFIVIQFWSEKLFTIIVTGFNIIVIIYLYNIIQYYKHHDHRYWTYIIAVSFSRLNVIKLVTMLLNLPNSEVFNLNKIVVKPGKTNHAHYSLLLSCFNNLFLIIKHIYSKVYSTNNFLYKSGSNILSWGAQT